MSRIIKKLLAAMLLISAMGIASASIQDVPAGEGSVPEGAGLWLCPPVCW